MKFSVAMCVYGKDNAEHFDLALNSIAEQTVKANEVVLVVDGEIPDDIKNVIEKYRTVFKNFITIVFETNKGHGEARRTSVEACTNDLIAIMDADDISSPVRFERQIKCFADNPTVDIVGGQITEFIDEPSNIVSKRIVPLSDEDVKQFMKYRCPFNQVTVMFKKSSYLKAGGYVDWFYNEDYYLWLRMYLIGCNFANIDDIVVNVRVGKKMYERRGGKKYYQSEKKLQKYMLENGVITKSIYRKNVAKRFIVQVLMPSWLRGIAYKMFARA